MALTGCFGTENNDQSNITSDSHIILDDSTDVIPISLEQDIVYMDSLYLDRIHDITVDDEGRVYMAGQKWNHLEVHKFSAEGEYLGSIGSLGESSGSFQQISRIQASESHIWVTDPELNRITQLDTASGVFIETRQQPDQ